MNELSLTMTTMTLRVALHTGFHNQKEAATKKEKCPGKITH